MRLSSRLSGKRDLLYEATPTLAPGDWEPAPPCLPCCETESRRAYRVGVFEIVACRRCGTARVDPRLRAEVRLERIYNRAEYFDAAPRSPSLGKRLRKAVWRRLVAAYQHPDAQQRRAQLIRRFAPTAGPVRFLEIGCGTGRLLSVLADLCPEWSLAGIEPSEFASQSCRDAGFRVLTGTVEQVCLPGEQFEAVCAWNVIEHVDDPRRFLEWIVAHLAPGGHVFLHTPNYGGLMRRIYGASWFEFKPEYHLYYFTYPGLTRLVEAAGLRRILPERVRILDNLGHQIRFVAQRPGGG
jgi:2-polyprenyl-3-methyl-5-hydroxy-6-metoxy-1,4-benzoquinol methylase